MEPSQFLLECLALPGGPLANIGELPAREAEEQPLKKSDLVEEWPKQPFGEERGKQVHAAAAAVTKAIETNSVEPAAKDETAKLIKHLLRCLLYTSDAADE